MNFTRLVGPVYKIAYYFVKFTGGIVLLAFGVFGLLRVGVFEESDESIFLVSFGDYFLVY